VKNRNVQASYSLSDVPLVQLGRSDMTTRLSELAALQDGWLDGAGTAPNIEQLRRFAASFDQYFPADLLLPHLYPTAEGGLQAEWSVGYWEVSLEMDLVSMMGEYQAYNSHTGQIAECTMALQMQPGWGELERQLRAIGATSA
jgi:hypothetical protein